MQATVKPTEQIVEINGHETRVWIGQTESGVPFQMLVACVAVHRDFDAEEFERALHETAAPTVDHPAFSLRLVLP